MNKRKFGTTGNFSSGGTQPRKQIKGKRKQPAKDNTAYQLALLKHQLRVISPQTKCVYYSGGASVGSSFASDGPAFPSKGGAANQRLGEKIELKSLNCRFLVTTSNSDTYDSMRITIVQYKDNNVDGSTPVDWVTNVFSTAAQTSYPWLAPFNSLKTPSYHILYDELIHVNENGEGEVSRNLMFYPKDFAVKTLDFTTDNGGQDAGLEEGTIKMLIVSNSTAVPNPAYEVVWRLNFTDT